MMKRSEKLELLSDCPRKAVHVATRNNGNIIHQKNTLLIRCGLYMSVLKTE